MDLRRQWVQNHIKWLMVSLVLAGIFLLTNMTVYSMTRTGETNNITARSGSIDLGSWNPQNGGVVALSGEWEFYYNKLLAEKDMANIAPDMLEKIPGVWNGNVVNGEKIPGEGFATYRLHVKTNVSSGDTLAMRIEGLPSAYRLFVGGELVAQNGNVAQGRGAEEASLTNKVATFTVPSSEFDILLQVSNFHYARGGLWSSIYLGSTNTIINFNNLLSATEMFLIGALVILFIYYLSFYIMRREIKQSLYFAFLCLLMAVLIDSAGQMYIMSIFPGMSFDVFFRIWYIPSSFIPFLLVMFVCTIFPKYSNRAINIIYFCISLAFALLYLVLPTWTSTRLVVYNVAAVLAGMLYATGISVKACRDKLKGAKPYLFGLVILMFCYFYDTVLYYTNITDWGILELTPFGTLAMVCIHSILQTEQIDELHKKKEQSIEKATAAEIAFLNAQIKPHFLYNALGAIANVCEQDGKKGSELIVDLSFYLRSNFEFNNLNKMSTLENELQFIHNYINIEKVRLGDRINYHENVRVPEDTQIPVFILEPLVENAVRHGISKKIGGGTVTLFADRTEGGIVFQIEDDGMGMDEKELKSLLSENLDSHSIGINNINMRLKRIYGPDTTLTIRTRPGEGTVVSFLLPAAQMEG